jgi:hypothetical protein
LNNPQVPFLDIAKASKHFIQTSTTGEVLILLGNLLLLRNLAALSLCYYRTHFKPVYEAAKAELKPAEVKP